jgi:NTP pyrophosphatase (non-canonical NTP hydrolase)
MVGPSGSDVSGQCSGGHYDTGGFVAGVAIWNMATRLGIRWCFGGDAGGAEDLGEQIGIERKFMMEITLKGCQEVVDEWVRTIGVRYYSELTNTAVLMEEVGEVARIMSRVYGDQSFKKSDEDYNLADEFADVFFVLICLANQTGVDLTEAFHRNMDKKTTRDKDRHANNPKLKE